MDYEFKKFIEHANTSPYTFKIHLRGNILTCQLFDEHKNLIGKIQKHTEELLEYENVTEMLMRTMNELIEKRTAADSC